MRRAIRALPPEPEPTPLEEAMRAFHEAQAALSDAAARVQVEAARELEQLEARRRWEQSEDRWMTVAETATYLRMSKDFIYQVCEKGRLPSTNFGAGVRIKKADLDAYVEQQQRQSA